MALLVFTWRHQTNQLSIYPSFYFYDVLVCVIKLWLVKLGNNFTRVWNYSLISRLYHLIIYYYGWRSTLTMVCFCHVYQIDYRSRTLRTWFLTHLLLQTITFLVHKWPNGRHVFLPTNKTFEGICLALAGTFREQEWWIFFNATLNLHYYFKIKFKYFPNSDWLKAHA